MFDLQRTQLLNALDDAHDAYHRSEPFGGPSVYFHTKALEAARARNFERFAECAYAMLASWGMHRMGAGGSKMRKFEDFQTSLQNVWAAALRLQAKTPSNLGVEDWSALRTIFCGSRCMASGTSLVGNSKVMAHLLPNLIPPVDREYTLKFLFGHGRINNAIESEWTTLQRILTDFFYPILTSPLFQAKAKVWLAEDKWRSWDTSELKIADNLVVGLSKSRSVIGAAQPSGMQMGERERGQSSRLK